MQQRRWERALGTAIREGQAVGEIRSNGQHASCGAVSSPSDYAKQADLTHPERGIYALADNATDAEFESALTTARDEGNVSRANVVRKLKSDGVIDMATGEVIDPDTLTPENRRVTNRMPRTPSMTGPRYAGPLPHLFLPTAPIGTFCVREPVVGRTYGL